MFLARRSRGHFLEALVSLPARKMHSRRQAVSQFKQFQKHVYCNIMPSSAGVHSNKFSTSSSDQFLVVIPPLGDSISEGTIVEFTKQAGESVAEDEVCAVVETDKVSVDIRSSAAGVVSELLKAVDDTVEVGTAIISINTSASSSTPTSQSSPSSPSASPTSSPQPEKAPPPASPTAAESSAQTHTRLPSIRFRHGANRFSMSAPSHSSATSPASESPHMTVETNFAPLQRTLFTPYMIELIEVPFFF
jgi:pyruvate/2-oxoglutarate dehydrogenase complex dihydrolipoamide acyltransferase (E2) component